MDKPEEKAAKPISQKALARYLKLSPSTISLVMNDAPLARFIPEATKQRVLEAARKFDYRPDFYAKYLSSKRSFSIAVLLPEIRESFAAAIVAGIDTHLVRHKFLYFTANHHDDETLIDEYPRRLIERAAEGFIFINTPVNKSLGRPVVAIGSQPCVEGVTRIALNNEHGGALALEHLASLGHRKIAVIKGHPWRASALERWTGICRAAQACGITIEPELIAELHSGNNPRQLSAPEEGYQCAQRLIRKKLHFTAIIAFNDVTAIGAIRALHEAGLKVPQDVSVVGFDDIEGAAYLMPSITTLHQPLQKMGELAARHLLEEMDGAGKPHASVLVDPILIARESTATPAVTAPSSKAGKRSRKA